ncbi:MAG: O-antigen ligase family protein, partial [Actinobacteria bacterium]
MSHALEVIGIIAAALLAGGAIVATSVRARAAAALGALALAPALLIADIWHSPQLASLRDRPAAAVGAALLGLVAVAGLALLLHRRPPLMPLLAVAALPFRIPISAGGSTASLLVPLYLVVAAGLLAYAVPRLRGEDDDAPHPPRALEWLLAAALVLYAVQSAWSSDFEKALQQVAFFYVPFALLFCLLREVAWTPRLLAACLGVLVALAVVFVGIGFVEYARKELFLNPKVITANQFEDYFRVNSLFFDPNIYGRFLALVMLAVTAAVLWRARTRDAVAGGVVLAVLWGGLLVTFSQSSFAALLAGLGVLAALRWSARQTALVAGALAVVAVAFVIVAPGAVHLDLGSSASADRATSGRVDLIAGGLRLFGDAPVLGHGSASFAREYRRHEDASSRRAVSASHTIPVTVAAEQGIVGLAVYLALLIAAFVRLARGARWSAARAFAVAAFAGL